MNTKTAWRYFGSYVLLTFLISYSTIWIIVGRKGIPATPELQQTIGALILLGPAIAGISLIAYTRGWRGIKLVFRRFLDWRHPLSRYLQALLIAPIATILSLWILSLKLPYVLPPLITESQTSELILAGLAGGFIVAFFEELGWSGFAVPWLRKSFGRLTTGLFIGLVWGAWHFILFWEKDSFANPIAFALLMARLFSWLPAFRLLMVWMYDKTQSLLLVLLMHVSLVLSLTIFDPVHILSASDLTLYIIIRAAILWIMALYYVRK